MKRRIRLGRGRGGAKTGDGGGGGGALLLQQKPGDEQEMVGEGGMGLSSTHSRCLLVTGQNRRQHTSIWGATYSDTRLLSGLDSLQKISGD